LATTKTHKVTLDLNFTKKFQKGYPFKNESKIRPREKYVLCAPICAEHESEHRLFLKIF